MVNKVCLVGRPRKFKNPTKSFVGSKTPVPAYQHWVKMKERCSEKYQSKYPTYIGVTYTEEWSDYDIFYEYITTIKGYGCRTENGVLFNLDKDIIEKGNKIYCPGKVCLIPSELNTLLTLSKNSRGMLPLGISLNSEKYMVTLSYDGKNKNLGRYDSLEEAVGVYKLNKEKIIGEKAKKYKEFIEPLAYEALMNWKINPYTD